MIGHITDDWLSHKKQMFDFGILIRGLNAVGLYATCSKLVARTGGAVI